MRYEFEMISVDWDEPLQVFGVCDGGIFCVNKSGCVVLKDEEDNSEILAPSTESFVRKFHSVVRAVLERVRLSMNQT